MRIDLHCHTKAIKTGESNSRNVSPKDFVKHMINKQVKIVAITNHNNFDFDQYSKIVELAEKEDIKVWPGVEIDVKGNRSKGHILVICNPKEVEKFYLQCSSIFAGKDLDKFEISIDDLLKAFQYNDIVLIAHYGAKKPSLYEEDLHYLKEKLKNKTPFFLETSNLRSAGILYAHNINSFIGSDVKDWSNYEKCELPELKMPISDYENFKLLVKKDEQVIETFVNQKESKNISINPFNDCHLDLKIYNDINIIFGGKGTGKSIILNEIKQKFESFGNSDVSYYSAQSKSEDYKKLVSINNEQSDFDKLNIDDCSVDFSNISSWKDSTIIPTKDYYNWANNKNNNELSSRFGFKNCTFVDIISKDKYDSLKKDAEEISKLIESIKNITNSNTLFLSNEEYDIFISLLEKAIKNAKEIALKEWISFKSLELKEFTIKKMKSICTSKTGTISLPSQTGLLDLYKNCLELRNSINNIVNGLNSESIEEKTKLGEIPNKGIVYLKKYITVNLEGKKLILPPNAKYKISELREIKEDILSLQKEVFTLQKNELLQKIIDALKTNSISSLRDFVCVKGNVCNSDGLDYELSSGEESILLLANAISSDDKNYYILDEPEMSLGHKYINDIVVGRIIELSKLNKTIVISTHDANIAVRTLPLLTVYREYGSDNKYKTFVGNAFTNKIINVENANEEYSWQSKSLEMLEGGEEAFIERGNTYGI